MKFFDYSKEQSNETGCFGTTPPTRAQVCLLVFQTSSSFATVAESYVTKDSDRARAMRIVLLLAAALAVAHGAVSPDCTPDGVCTIGTASLDALETSWSADTPSQTLSVMGTTRPARRTVEKFFFRFLTAHNFVVFWCSHVSFACVQRQAHCNACKCIQSVCSRSRATSR